MRSIVTLAVIVFAVHLSAVTVFGCSCGYREPRDKLCDATNVVVVDVQTEQVVQDQRMFGVKVKRVVKGSQKLKSVEELITPVSDGLCGVQLTTGHRYLLQISEVNGSYGVYLCSLNEDWSGKGPKKLKKMLINSNVNKICEGYQ